MGVLTERGQRRAPYLMLIAGLALIGWQTYTTAGPDAVQYAIGFSLKKLLIQVPAGIVAILVASRLIENDWGTIKDIILRIAGITILAEGVGCWIPIPFFSIIAEITVELIGFFLLFELSKWETYLVVFLNFAALFGAHYLIDNYVNTNQSFGSRPAYRRR
jgi:hypothetical protein